MNHTAQEDSLMNYEFSTNPFLQIQTLIQNSKTKINRTIWRNPRRNYGTFLGLRFTENNGSVTVSPFPSGESASAQHCLCSHLLAGFRWVIIIFFVYIIYSFARSLSLVCYISPCLLKSQIYNMSLAFGFSPSTRNSSFLL